MKLKVSQKEWDEIRANYMAHDSGAGDKLLKLVDALSSRMEAVIASGGDDKSVRAVWCYLTEDEDDIELLQEAMFLLFQCWKENDYFFYKVLSTIERFFLVSMLRTRMAQYEAYVNQK